MRFGEQIRVWRLEKQIGLREFARQIGLSPTFVSKFERDEFPPPGEPKLREIARVLGKDADLVTSLAKRIPSDLPPIIQEHPQELAAFLRTARGLGAEQIRELTEQARRLKRG